MYHTMAKIAPSTTTPPIAPPAIAPAFTDEDEVAGETVDETLGGLVEDVKGGELVDVIVVVVKVIALVGTKTLRTLFKFSMG